MQLRLTELNRVKEYKISRTEEWKSLTSTLLTAGEERTELHGVYYPDSINRMVVGDEEKCGGGGVGGGREVRAVNLHDRSCECQTCW